MKHPHRLYAALSIAMTLLAVVVALASGRPGDAVREIEKAAPAVEALLADTDDTDHPDTEVP